jgi:6-phosphogluconolactonase (cycloisomerase 2 family)
VPGATLAFQAGPGGRLTTYQVVAATGCWAKLDEDAAASDVADLGVDPSGRFLYASTRVADRESGVEAFRIDAARGALEPIGRFVLDVGWFDHPGPILATEDSVYMITRPIGTGYHGGLFRFAIDRGSGRLQFRHLSFRSREPAFLEWWPSRSLLYVWMEDLSGPPYVLLRALRIARDGDLSRGPEISIEWGQAEADPAGVFLWMTQGDTGFDTLDAYVPGTGGALTRASTTPWQHGPPAAHPSGRVLYAISGARLDAYAVDPDTGAPRLATSAPAPPDAYRVAVDPSGQFAFVATGAVVRGYRTDAAGGLREIGTVAGAGRVVTLLTVR